MKKIYRISLMLFALALCGLAACSKSEVDDVVSRPSGDLSQVKLTFDVQSSPEFETRAAQSTYYEYLVQNIYVFVFNGDKRVELSKNFFEPGDGDGYIVNYKNKEDNAGNTQSSGTINFDAVSGSGLKICAIANIGTSNSVMGDLVTRATTNDTGSTGDGSGDDVTTDADIAKLDAITSYTELKKLSVELKSNSIFRGASFLMTGEVTANLVANQTTTVEIPLSRTDSKITFNVTAASTDSNISEMEFIPGKWRVVNVPVVSYVLPHIGTDDAAATLTEDKDATIEESDFFSVSESEAPQFEGTVGGAANSGTFTFYMYENLKKPTKEIADADVPSFESSNEGNLKYALREMQTKTPIENTDVTGVVGQTYVNGDFVYAPKFGTYVVLTGELSYTEGTGDSAKYVIADVEYCVHLGHGSVDNVNSYNTLRNHHYTYNVTITGVNSLVVEVDDDQEERPGAEGDVVISASEIHNVDGHYDRALIKLSKEEASKLLFSVSTPFERGIDDMTGDAELKDYKWIKFLVNSEVGVADTSYAAFPGEQCYDGGASAQGTAATSSVYGKSVVLRDIRQLSNYFAANNPTGDVYITAFVDEYLYFYDPTTDNVVTNGATTTTYKSAYTATDAADLLMWKQSVNTNDRMLHIVKAGDMKYSADGDTSVSRSVVTFKQRPVLTFYNVAADGLTTAWGTETINETPKMTVTRTSYPSTTGYNYYQQAQRLTAYSGTSTQNSWAKVISSTEQYGLGDDFQDPSYACALRNRDFDGDGTINQNEVQWYLAALDQMSDLWIGEPAMPKYAHLYDEENPDGKFGRDGYIFTGSHYVTSTISGTSPKVYWAEECGASSTHDQAISWRQAPTSNTTYQTKYINYTDDIKDSDEIDAYRLYAEVSVRCVRNLGKAYSDTTEPQDYITISGGTPSSTKTNRTTNEYQINLDYINPLALRTVSDNGNALPNDVLDTPSENNRPYVSFFVYPTSYLTASSGVTWDDVAEWNKNNDRESIGCPEGYRVPNQREMTIMNMTVDGWYATTDWSGGLMYNWYTMLNHQIIKCYDQSGVEYKKTGCFFLRQDNFSITRGVGDAVLATEADPAASAHDPAVRCVKDNQGYTPPSAASTYNNGGSAVQ